MVNLNKFNKFELGEILTPEKIYKFPFKKNNEELFEKLYFDNFNYIIISNLFILSIFITLIVYVLMYPSFYIWFNSWLSAGFIYSFIIIFFIWILMNLIFYYSLLFFYFFYNDSKFKKIGEKIEKDLPEFLDNLVSNIKGGISLEKAILKSVRINQKELLKEMSLVNQKILMGINTQQALKEFASRFESPILSRTFLLINESLEGGGNIAEPLERISQNLKKIYQLNDEIKADSGGFSLIIRAITLIVAPLLFSLAITLLTFISHLIQLLSKSGTTIISVSSIPQQFPQYLMIFSYAMIIIITFFSSLITAQLKNEKIYESLKYIPIYITIALFLFSIMSKILLGFFSGILR